MVGRGTKKNYAFYFRSLHSEFKSCRDFDFRSFGVDKSSVSLEKWNFRRNAFCYVFLCIWVQVSPRSTWPTEPVIRFITTIWFSAVFGRVYSAFDRILSLQSLGVGQTSSLIFHSPLPFFPGGLRCPENGHSLLADKISHTYITKLLRLNQEKIFKWKG